MELVVAVSVLVSFILLTSYFMGWLQPFYGQQLLQADLSARAQMALDRVLSYRPYNPAKSVGLGLDGVYVDDRLVYLYAMASPRPGLGSCTINSQALANFLGTSTAYRDPSFGWVLYVGSPALVVNYTAMVADLFGSVRSSGFDKRPPTSLYDFWLEVRPLVETRCPADPGSLAATLYMRSAQTGGPVDGVVSYSAYVVKRGTNVVCSLAGTGRSSGGVFPLSLARPFACDDGSTYTPQPGDRVVAVFEKVDSPYAICVNATSNAPSYAYAMLGLGGAGMRLYVVHNSVISCQGSTTSNARLGVRYVDIYAAGSRLTVAQDVTLDPGVGQGSPHVDSCGACTGSASCTACYVDNIPRGARVAVISVETSADASAGGGADVLVVPLVPYRPFLYVNLTSWSRWGLAGSPSAFSAIATRVADGLAYSYYVKMTVYRWP